jgi:hypothetical protein
MMPRMRRTPEQRMFDVGLLVGGGVYAIACDFVVLGLLSISAGAVLFLLAVNEAR